MGDYKICTCKVCDKSYKNRQNLSQHKQNCSKKSTYNCEQCSKSFIRRDCKIVNFHIHGS